MKILEVAETHWNNTVEDSFEQGCVIINSARKDGIKRLSVAIIIEKELSKSLTSYEQTLERIISVNLDTNVRPVTIIQVYAPDSSHDTTEIENFCNIL